jgi:hypothetical protein
MADGPKPVGLLFKVRGETPFGAVQRDAVRILDVDVAPDRFGFGAGTATWYRVPARDSPWDEAHAIARRKMGLDGLLAVEPDLEQGWDPGLPSRDPACKPAPQTDAGGQVKGPEDGWHLLDAFSGLRTACAGVAEEQRKAVRIAHLDTGYDPDHGERPRGLLTGAQWERSFVGGVGGSAIDRTGPGLPGLRNRGHGTGTLGILAGPTWGAIPDAQVLPVRVGDGVVRFTTSSIAAGFDWALLKGANVLSMSMGGVASRLLADAINKCYEAGLVMVTAAGNNFRRLPVGSIVYPARHARVVAATGVMADGTPYGFPPVTAMSGCFGPMSKMATALAAYTPNIPWARIGCGTVVDMDGGGTSSATPQIAAAAALWIARHRAAYDAYPEAWMRGEAVRQALFRHRGLRTPDPKLGWGALKAPDLLRVAPPEKEALARAPVARAGWDILKLLTGKGMGLDAALLASADLFELEILQLVGSCPELQALVADPDAGVTEGERRRLLEALEAHGEASRALRRAAGLALEGHGSVPARTPPGPPPTPPAAAPRMGDAEPPRRRRLRIFALDPSLGKELANWDDRIATISVLNEPDLLPGPVGEYLEVVDLDPASDRLYPPVDLNATAIALADGLEPSEGNPRFHQQMVYGVAMQTIEAFEKGLGRRALWAGTSHFRKRLRIHPHALRDENAFYSPDRLALLFGYFPASGSVNAVTPAGTMVFSCLSADIIAHETTHALLDGFCPGFRDPANPDVLAFHEGFADIVALFQQFGYRDLVRRQVARARGRLSGLDLLGGLARQFGESTGRKGPLRRYPDLPEGMTYAATERFHDRGSILVSAVFRAFLAIAERRMEPYVRLATGGSGVLSDGALHPDLVETLAGIICQTATEMQKICIRALDYLPPVDVTFGEYLRAIITGDMDAWPDDPSGYRVALLEAFRRYGMHPQDLRTLSVETLRWDPPPPALRRLPGLSRLVRALRIRPALDLSRAEIHRLAFRRKVALEQWLSKLLRDDLLREDGKRELHALLGLAPGLPHYVKVGFDRDGRPTDDEDRVVREEWEPAPETLGRTNFYVDGVRIKRRDSDTGQLGFDVIARVRQRRPEWIDPEDPSLGRFWFRGGSTIILDPFARREGARAPELRFVVRKSMTSVRRLAGERAYRQKVQAGDLRAAYFAAEDDLSDRSVSEPFALVHKARSSPE